MRPITVRELARLLHEPVLALRRIARALERIADHLDDDEGAET